MSFIMKNLEEGSSSATDAASGGHSSRASARMVRIASRRTFSSRRRLHPGKDDEHDRVTWEAVAAAIKRPLSQVSDDEVLSLVEKFRACFHNSEDDAADGGPVDMVGCAETETWAKLVQAEKRYVELHAHQEYLRPQLEQVKARWRWIEKHTLNLSCSAGDEISGAIMLVLALAVAILFAPLYVYKWHVARTLKALEREQALAFDALNELGACLCRTSCSTLLHVAVAAGRERVVSALLKHGSSLKLVDTDGRSAHALSTSASMTAVLDAEAERRRVIAKDATGVRLEAEVMARNRSGEYVRGTIKSVSPDNATCTVVFTSNGGDASDGEARTCGCAHVLTIDQWRVHKNRNNHLLRQAVNLKSVLAQVVRHGASPSERRQHFSQLLHEQGHLVPMMSVVPYRTLASRLEAGKSIPNSSEMVAVPVTALPAKSAVCFFSHTRLQERSPDNKHNVKLRGILEAMTMFAEKNGLEPELMYAWIDEACIDQETWGKHPDIGMSFVYALPIFVACSECFVYAPYDRASKQVEELKYENRAWCRVEVLVGHAVVQPPLTSEPQEFERYRLELFRKSRDNESSNQDDVLVQDMDGVRVVREVTKVGSPSPALNPGKGVLTVESDRPPLVLISNILGHKSGANGSRRASRFVGAVEVSENEQRSADTLRGAYKYIKHSFSLTFAIAVAGVVFGGLPLSMVANRVGADMLVNAERLGTNATTSSGGSEFIILRDMPIWSSGWPKNDDGDSVDVPSMDNPVAVASWWAGVNAYTLIGMPWLIAHAISTRLNGWEATRGRVLVVAVLCWFVHAACVVAGVIVPATPGSAANNQAFSAYYPVVLFGLPYVIAAPVRGKWRGVFLVVFVLAVGENFIRRTLRVYFSSDAIGMRLGMRSVAIPAIKIVSTHLAMLGAEQLDFANKENLFLLVLAPLAMCVAAASVMQLAAASPGEALLMQALAMIGELFEYMTYMSGKTHMEQWSERASGLAKGTQRLSRSLSGGFEIGSLSRELSRAYSRSTSFRTRSVSVVPTLDEDELEDFEQLGVVKEEDEEEVEEVEEEVVVEEDLDDELGGRVGGGGEAATTSNSLEESGSVVSDAAARKQTREKIFCAMVKVMGIFEGAASAMTLGLFLLSPLRPSEVGEPREETQTLLLLWFITLVFEVVLPEGTIAFVSQQRGENQFSEVMKRLRQNVGFKRKDQLVIGIVLVSMVTYMHKIMIDVLCPTPWEDTGRGLMSIAACCSDEVDGATPCD